MTRHRTNKFSVERTSSHGSSTKSRGKGKQVVFDENIQLRSPILSAEESELTDLSELESKVATAPTSPRRLRSRDKSHGDIAAQAVRDPDSTPRQIRCKIRDTQDTEPVEDEDEIMEDEEEIDELASSPSPTPPSAQGRRTPVKRRLRPRRLQARTPTSDDGGDGDDEEEEAEIVADERISEEDVEEELDEDEGYEDDCQNPPDNPPECAPRKLRSGKVVGGDDSHDAEDEDEEDEDEDEDEPDLEIQDQEIDLEVESVDLDGDDQEDFDDEGDEVMDDNDCG